MKEDYVSYEVAKLLKEKGFDWECNQIYFSDNPSIYLGYKNINHNEDVTTISAPTHQMAMRWLREVHKIIISFNASFFNSIEQHFDWNIRINSLKYLDDKEHFDPIYINTKSEVFEEAVEDAIKYCLTNLF